MACTLKDWRLVVTQERGNAKTRLVLWYRVCGETPVLMVVSRDAQGKEKDDFFFSTDPDASPEEFISRYAGRWAIEDTFRSVKQHLGGEDPQSWRKEGPERAAAFSFFLYSVVWCWYIRTQGTRVSWKPLPWYPSKRTPSFADALACLRRVLWHQRIIINSESPSILPEIASSLIDILSRVA